MSKRITVVISQGQSAHPAKRRLEEDLVAGLLGKPNVELTVVPHLYDLAPDSTGMLCLSGVSGDMIVCSWLYPRAARWTLDRNGIRGSQGATLLKALGESDDEDDVDVDDLSDDATDEDRADADKSPDEADDDKHRVADYRPAPPRTIWCLDLRTHDSAEPYLAEIERITTDATVQTVELNQWSATAHLASSANSGATAHLASSAGDSPEDASFEQSSADRWIQGSPTPQQMDRYLGNGGVSAPGATAGSSSSASSGASGPIKLTSDDVSLADGASATDSASQNGAADRTAVPNNIVDEVPARRWYPVIDFSRCTNCMECIDFCLFGVYGIDRAETILVEQPDNCRKGCPACSRVCPENAIIFPQHKTPTIAGSAEVAGTLKIDLSQLFGAPDLGAPEPGAPGTADAIDVAARERDEQLLLAGRQAVGLSVGIPKRQAERPSQPKDDLDHLMDELDDADL